jgi:hypothetical protein
VKHVNRSAITLYATQEFLVWVHAVEPKLHRWTLETLNHRPSVYLFEIEDQNCEEFFVRDSFQGIVLNELACRYIPRDKWPKEITRELFESWFSLTYHEGIFDLSQMELLGNAD